ncbi:MAG: M1 family metallopeptidase [Candidatus Zhuqueibacterota bacterium]
MKITTFTKTKTTAGMRSFLALALAMTLLISDVPAQSVIFKTPLSPRIANYQIDVALDAETRTLQGEEILTWHNHSRDSITELQFHLYLNAFRNDQSTYMKESGQRFRDSHMSEENLGFIDIIRIVQSDSQDVTAQLEFIHPDDANEFDKTVARLPLASPVNPGDSVVLTIDFIARLPQPPIERTGAFDEYFFVAQWFPKIGVYQNGAWNCHQYHKDSEFFADFGVYDVRITAPSRSIVAATGLEMSAHKNGNGTATHVYHAEDVHDFAWCTSPEFIEFTDTVQDVRIRALMQPDHAGQGQRHLSAVRVAIEYFQDLYGDYPYPNLTLIDPHRNAMATGGMEYPTLITGGTNYFMPGGIRMPEMVIIHEFGHNYWYGMVASNEFEEAWLDEGINSYCEHQILHDYYGPDGDIINFMGLWLNDVQLQRAGYIFSPDLDPIVRPAWQFVSTGSYGVNSYQKPALMLLTLQNYLGPDMMKKIMQTYFERWKFKHPTTGDFFAVAEEIYGQDLDWFFDQAFFSNRVLDYAVSTIVSREIKQPSGFDFNYPAHASTDSGEAPDSLSSLPVDAAKDSAQTKERGGKETGYSSEVTVRRLGDFIFPVTIELTFANGEKMRHVWDGQNTWKRFTHISSSRLISAEIDPERRVPIDVNFTNNSRTQSRPAGSIVKYTLQFMTWMQLFLDSPDVMNMLLGFSGQ